MGHTSFQYNRRTFMRNGVLAAGALSLGPPFLKRAFAAGPVTVGNGPYGPLYAFDGNGIALPAGFTSREIARGQLPVAGSAPPYIWHGATDGQATFATLDAGGAPDGGWILVANSEVPGGGGASAVRFGGDGTVQSAYRILAGTSSNCAGGPTPWGTWLSCEEYEGGRVWECDPTGAAAVVRPALGAFAHEAACVDPVRGHLYLTEDEPDGCLYRFTPTVYPDLSAGVLEAAVVDGPGTVSWAPVPDPGGGPLNPTRSQVPGAAKFRGGEGTWFDDGIVYFTTKGDNRVWALDVEASQIEVLYDREALGADAPLSGVDNITVAPSGDIFVCEDGGDLDICMITPGFEISRFLKLDPKVHSGPPAPNPVAGNETVGVVFDPFGRRMYFGAQRSFAVAGSEQIPAGVVYEIEGPFRLAPTGDAGGSGGGLSVVAKPRRSIARLLRKGMPISVEVDEVAGLRARLRVPRREPSPKRELTIARATTTVAVRGKLSLMLEPGRHAREILAHRRRVDATLEVVASYGDGRRDTATRRVVLFRESG